MTMQTFGLSAARLAKYKGQILKHAVAREVLGKASLLRRLQTQVIPVVLQPAVGALGHHAWAWRLRPVGHSATARTGCPYGLPVQSPLRRL